MIKQAEEDAQLKQYTFRPKVRKRPSSAPKSRVRIQTRNRGYGSDPEDIPVSEKLYHEADHRAAVREAAKLRMEEEELMQCTFTPQVRMIITPSK